MKQYIDVARQIIQEGVNKEDRTGTGTRSVFGTKMTFDLANGFPLLTTKEMPFRIIGEELLWFLSGNTNIRTLVLKGVNIWNADAYRVYARKIRTLGYEPLPMSEFVEAIRHSEEFADKWGELGSIYSKQWRSWTGLNGKTVDQIKEVIHNIKTNPDSRRLVVSAWNPAELEDMALPPCHVLFQFYVANNKLSCQLYQRSGDLFLGVGFNVASYSLLLHMIAHVCELEVGEFVHIIGDTHIYNNHIEQIVTQAAREPYPLPTLKINRKVTDIFDFTMDDFTLEGYVSHPTIKGAVSVGT